MPPRKKKDAPIEPPARKEIGTFDVTRDYPRRQLIDVDNSDDVREAWEITERVFVVIDGEKIAADPGDLVYKLSLPGAGEKLEVLSRDVAIAMYEIRDATPSSFFKTVIGGPAEEHHPDAPPEPTVGDENEAAGDRQIGELERVAHDLASDRRTHPEGTIFQGGAEERRDGEERRQGVADRRIEAVMIEHEERRLIKADRRGSFDREIEEDLDRVEHGAALLDAGIPLSPGVVAVMESTVRWMKKQRKAWRDLSEREQDNELADLDRILSERVRELVVDIASREFPYVHATLEKVEFSDGIKATLTIPTQSEHRHELADHAKQTVTVVLAGAASWTAGERPRPEPDQAQLM